MSSLLSLLTRILSRKKLIIKNIIDKTSLLGIKHLRLFDVLTICFFSISDKQIIYKLPHKLPNDLSAQSSSQNKTFVNTSKKLMKNRNRTFRVVRYFTSKLQFISNILFMIVCYKV